VRVIQQCVLAVAGAAMFCGFKSSQAQADAIYSVTDLGPASPPLFQRHDARPEPASASPSGSSVVKNSPLARARRAIVQPHRLATVHLRLDVRV
jgi:hypothetical protein